jgi:hypothetical protein
MYISTLKQSIQEMSVLSWKRVHFPNPFLKSSVCTMGNVLRGEWERKGERQDYIYIRSFVCFFLFGLIMKVINKGHACLDKYTFILLI